MLATINIVIYCNTKHTIFIFTMNKFYPPGTSSSRPNFSLNLHTRTNKTFTKVLWRLIDKIVYVFSPIVLFGILTRQNINSATFDPHV